MLLISILSEGSDNGMLCAHRPRGELVYPVPCVTSSLSRFSIFAFTYNLLSGNRQIGRNCL